MENLILTPRFLDALEFAALAHQDQKRKFPEVPYICHPYSVAMILHRAGYPEDVLIAGLLHDVVEDTYFTDGDLRGKFGDEVADIVKHVTEDKTLPHKERKEDYTEKVRQGNDFAKAVSAADLLSNRLSTLLPLQQGKDPWEKLTSGSREEYLQMDEKRLEVLTAALGSEHQIIKNINAVTEEIRKISKI